jgi:hypothetical protein
MQKVVMVGNCHMTGIRRVLGYTTFASKYTVEQFANWEMIERKDVLPIQSLKSADVVIYQPLSHVHGCYSTENMLQFCSQDALLISVPRIHNNALWPIYAKRYAKDIYYGGEYLEDYPDVSRQDILAKYDARGIDFKFKERFDRNIALSTVREQDTDVKVVKFILDNIRNRQLFLTQDHPTTCVFQHVVEQLIDPLRISFTSSIDNAPDNIANLEDSAYHLPTKRYPQSSLAVEAFGLNWVTQTDDLFYRQRLCDHLAYLKI